MSINDLSMIMFYLTILGAVFIISFIIWLFTLFLVELKRRVDLTRETQRQKNRDKKKIKELKKITKNNNFKPIKKVNL